MSRAGELLWWLACAALALLLVAWALGLLDECATPGAQDRGPETEALTPPLLSALPSRPSPADRGRRGLPFVHACLFFPLAVAFVEQLGRIQAAPPPICQAGGHVVDLVSRASAPLQRYDPSWGEIRGGHYSTCKRSYRGPERWPRSCAFAAGSGAAWSSSQSLCLVQSWGKMYHLPIHRARHQPC